MRYLSVCSGIEAASVAWEPLGWTPVAFSEVDTFPSAVLAHHYPDTPNVGDMTAIATGDTDVGPFDLLIGGTPCQSFSVAGLRKGLADPRGNLALAFLGIADRYRPEWILWENVPGVLSSNGGRDFGAFLGGLGKLGYGWCYRVLNAQYFGVPQRRRRVFVVGHLGDWRRAAAVLFERESLRRDTPPGRGAGEDVAVCPTLRAGGNSTGGDRLPGTDVDTADSLLPVAQCVTTGTGRRYDAETETLVPLQEIGKRTGQSTDDPRAGIGIGLTGDPMFTLQAGAQHAVAFTGNVTHALNTANNGKMSSEDGTGRGVPTVAYGVDADNFDRSGEGANGTPRERSGLGVDYETAYSLRAKRPGGVATQSAVRRLTPTECERLQGFPDGYTVIPHRNGQAANGPRYKALGNSMAVPVVRWIGERIQRVRDILDRENAA